MGEMIGGALQEKFSKSFERVIENLQDQNTPFNNRIQCALYEADGGAWKLDAMKAIKAYLEEALSGSNNYIIIS